MMLDDSTFNQTGWRPPVAMTNSITGEGVDELIEYIFDHKEHQELSALIKERKKKRFAYKVRELLYNKIDHVLESLISQEEINDISTKAIDNKFQIYDNVHDLFSDVKFERKKKE